MDETKNSAEMAKGKNTCACACGAGCGCAGGCGRGYHVIWWVVGIVILVFVFALGVKAGEFRDEFRGAFGNNYYRSYPMQRVYNNGGVPPVAPPTPVEVATTTSGQ